MTQIVANQVYTQGTGTTSTDPFITIIETRDPSVNDINFSIGKRWFNKENHHEFILSGFTSFNSQIEATWEEVEGAEGAGIESLTGNSGGAVFADMDGNVDTVGDGTTINIVGDPGTYTLTANVILPAEAHSVLIGEISSIAGVPPEEVSGIPLISKGLTSDPDYGTAVVPGGGTGATSFTAYSVICGGTASANPLQNVVGVGTEGQVLTSMGPGELPQWQPNTLGGLDWILTSSAAFGMEDYHGYVCSTSCTAIVPGSGTNSSTIGLVSKIATGTGAITIQAQAGQFLSINGVVSASMGTAVSTAIGNSITLIYISSDSTWYATSVIGNWTVT